MVDITGIIAAIIGLLTAVLIILVIPIFKQRTTEEQREAIEDIIYRAVSAAEQLFPNFDGEKKGKEKLEYVVQVLEKQGITFDVEDITDEIRVMIESTVKNLFGN